MYYDWMMERYLGKDTPRGDLAGDMRRAGDFPRSDDKETLLRYPFGEERLRGSSSGISAQLPQLRKEREKRRATSSAGGPSR